MDGRIEVEGDLVRFLEASLSGYGALVRPPAIGIRVLASKWMDLWQDNSRHGSRNNIHRHYDLGNDFYKLWLDDQLLYTCAYFPTPSSTLEHAQIAKMDHVCRKLRLQPGETVVEAGCGWGALALHMAREYGVSVKAYNVSHEQIAFARERARAEGLSHRVEFIEDDYRAISGKFDVFVSVGMLEHVGLGHYQEFSEIIHRSIGDTGRGLLHFIGRNYPAAFSRWIRKHIFPGGFVPSLRQSLRVLDPKNYSVLDVENLRMHYAKTLEHWLERFDKSRHQVTGDVRFPLRARVAPVPGGIDRGVSHRPFAVVPDCLHGLAAPADVLDPRSVVHRCRRRVEDTKPVVEKVREMAMEHAMS